MSDLHNQHEHTMRLLTMSLAVTITSLCLFGQSEAAELPWELGLGTCGELAQATTQNKQIMCADDQLREASAALVAAYKQKAEQLNPSQLDALRIDHNLWTLETCVGDRTGAHPLSPTTALACLRDELPKRRQFVLALPFDDPEKPYRLSRFERALLQRYAGLGIGLISGMDSHSKRPEDAVRAALRRVLKAVLPGQLALPDARGSPESQFIQTMFSDSAGKVVADRFFVDDGAKPRDGAIQGLFVVDMTTGDVALAAIDASRPRLRMWQKACASSALKEFSRPVFRKAAAEAKDIFQTHDDLSEDLQETPCKRK